MRPFRAPSLVLMVLLSLFACGEQAKPEEVSPAPAIEEQAPAETAEAGSGPPPEVQAYVLDAAEKAEAMGEALSAFGGLMMEPRLADQDWLVEAATHMAIVQLTHEELAEMEVPLGMVEFHRGLLEGTQDCYDAMDYASSGIRKLNSVDLDRAMVLLASCGTKLYSLPAELEAYMAQFE